VERSCLTKERVKKREKKTPGIPYVQPPVKLRKS
jgi:hypothetical protein